MRLQFLGVVALASMIASGEVSIAGAQRVILQIRPRVGDTLRMRLDQQTEMTGVKRTSTGDANATVLATMSMFSRAIVEGASTEGTSVLAVTDSVLMFTTDERSRAEVAHAALQMRGQRVRFRVSPDGTVGMDGSADGASREVAQVVSLMPAAFPRGQIRVGDRWTRDMPLPTGSQLGAEMSGKLHVAFRLDSVVHGGDWAFVSMRGEMEPATGPGAVMGTVLDKGLVDGTMLIDQRRRWLTESWFNIVVSSTVTAAASGGGSMRMQMRIKQHMQTVR